jgi:hypothetical protein
MSLSLEGCWPSQWCRQQPKHCSKPVHDISMFECLPSVSVIDHDWLRVNFLYLGDWEAIFIEAGLRLCAYPHGGTRVINHGMASSTSGSGYTDNPCPVQPTPVWLSIVYFRHERCKGGRKSGEWELSMALSDDNVKVRYECQISFEEFECTFTATGRIDRWPVTSQKEDSEKLKKLVTN